MDIFKSIESGDLDAVKEYLKENNDINIKNSKNEGLLNIAVEFKQNLIVRYLVEQGIDVNSPDEDEFTPLMYYAQKGMIQAVNFLIENKADVNAIQNLSASAGRDALSQAFQNKHHDVVRLLVKNGAKVNDSVSRTETLLMAYADDPEMVKFLLSHNADPNKSIDGISPLMLATSNLESVKALVEAGADVNYVNSDSALTHAASKNNFEMVDYLLAHTTLTEDKKVFNGLVVIAAKFGQEKLVKNLIENYGASINAVDNNYNSVFKEAVSSGNKSLIEFLLGHEDLEIEQQNKLGGSAILEAIDQNDVDLVGKIVNKMIDKKINFNNRNHDGITPLYAAAKANNNAIIKLLIDKGADVDGGSHYRNPIQVLTKNDNLEAIKLLERKGLKLLADRNNGNDLLTYAAEHNSVKILSYLISLTDDKKIYIEALVKASKAGKFEAVKILVEAGADVNMKNADGNTAIIYAGTNVDVVNYLIDNKARVNSLSKRLENALFINFKDINALISLIDNGIYLNQRSDSGHYPLTEALSDSKFDVAKVLIERGADVNVTNNSGYTPLHHAIKNKNLEMVRLLVEYGADIFHEDQYGRNYITTAAQEGCIEIIEFLTLKKVNINHQNDSGETPLMAVVRYKPDIIDGIINDMVKLGANIDIQDKSGLTAIMIAVKNRSANLVRDLLNNNCDYTLRDNAGETAIEQVDLNVDFRIAGVILDKQIEDRNIQPETLFLLVKNGYTKAIKDVYDKGFDFNVHNKDGDSLLFIATSNNTEFKKLVKMGVDINHVNNAGENVLFKTIEKRSSGLTEYLFELGININQQDKNGQSALTHALKAEKQNKEQITSLIKNNADIHIIDVNGASLLSYAKSPFIEMLVEKGVNVNTQDKDGRTIFMSTKALLDATLFEKILNAGADVSLTDNYGHDVGYHIHDKVRLSDARAQLEQLVLKHSILDDEETNSMGL